MKIGAFTFGGGYAMIPLIQKEVADEKEWISHQDILEVIAIAESTPGPIAINAATFIGYRVQGFWGAFLATCGVVLPSFVIISVISLVLQQFENQKIVQHAFQGIRAGVLALIVKALISLYKQCPKNLLSYLIMAFAFAAVVFCKISVLAVILCCAAVGLAASHLADRRDIG
ncbi:MAG: chromate transporter [Muribaculum sp.]|nr:chromate transporter [Muribaculum sp.]